MIFSQEQSEHKQDFKSAHTLLSLQLNKTEDCVQECAT